MVKPVTDEVGKAIEQGAQSILGATPKPQNQAQPQPVQNPQQDVSKMNEARYKLDYWKRLSEEQARLRQQKKQQQNQAVQQTEQKKQIKQFEIVKKQKKDIALQQAKTKTEIKGGVGG